MPAGFLVLMGLSWTLAAVPWEPDESRYLEIAREMASSGDWIVPTLNGVPYLEKPPLYVVLIAAIFRLFGPSDIAARAVSVAAGAGTVLVTSGMVGVLCGRRPGLRAGLILATSPLFFVLSTLVTIDMLLTFWVTCAIAGFAYGTTGADAERPCRTAVLLGGYLALGLAVLTKGPVALAVPGLVWIFWRPLGLRRILPPCFLPGIALLLAVAVPWFVIVQLRFPTFWDFFFIRGHLGRIAGADVENVNFHGESPFYYVPILLGGAAPWILFLRAPWHASASDAESPYLSLGWSWIVPGFVFFSVVAGKLPTYMLPLFPGVAILAANEWECVEARRPWTVAKTALAALLLSGGFGALLSARALGYEIWWAEYVSWPLAWAALAFCVAGLAAAVYYLRRRRDSLSFGCITLSFALLLFFGGFLKSPVSRAVSVDGLARAVRSVAGPGDAMVCVNKYLPLFAFHLERPVFVCGDRGELDYGSEELKLRPDLFLDFAALKARLDGPGRVFMSMSRRRLPKFESTVGRKLHVLGSTRNTFLVSNQAEPWPFRPEELSQP